MQQGFLVKSADTESGHEQMDTGISGQYVSEEDNHQRGDVTALSSVLKESIAPITGHDQSLYFGQMSLRPGEESAVDIPNLRRSSYDEPRLGAEAPTRAFHREGGDGNQNMTPLDPCSTPSENKPTHVNARGSHSPRGSSTSGEECELDESYPHHKKFRMHRKRPAVVNPARSTENTTKCEMNNNEISTLDMKKCRLQDSHENVCSTPEMKCNSQNADLDDSDRNSKCNKETFEPTIDQLGHASREASPFPSPQRMSPDVRYAYVCPPSNHDAFHLHDQITANPEQVIPVATNELHECRWLQCTRKFLQLDDLVNHVNDAHIRAERDIDYKCYWENCPRRGKGFNARYKMLIHVRTHTNERPYKCNLCSKSFSRLENLKIHNRSHTGERPYVCPFEGCNKAYSNSSDRFKHVRTHQEQKPYCCRMPGCDKRYTDPSSLRKHIKTHGHYYRPASEEHHDKQVSPEQDKREESESALANGRSESLALESKLVRKDILLPSKSALSNPPTFLSTYSSVATHPLLTHSAPVPISLNSEDFRQLRVMEDVQHKALLEGSLLSALSLPRPPLLSLPMPFGVADTPCYSLTPSSLHGISNHLAASKSFESPHRLTTMGSPGSISPPHYSDSHSPSPRSSSAPTDSEGSNSPLLSRLRSTRSALDVPMPSPHNPYTTLNVSVGSGLHGSSPPQAPVSPPQALRSAFSPVSLSHSAPDKYSFLSHRSAFVSRTPRHSPTHHPYTRPPSRGSQELGGAISPNSYPVYESHSPAECPSASPSHPGHSPKLSPLPYMFSNPRSERPLDLSNPSSPEMLSDREGSPRMSPPSPYHTVPSLFHMRCHQPPKCDLGPAFPALHLLNHA